MQFLKHIPGWLYMLSISAGILFFGCKTAAIIGGPLDNTQLMDGIYEGESAYGPNSAKVRITIQDHKLTGIELLSHDAWKGHKADVVIPQRITEQQSTRVDAVSGATNSSHVLMNAVENAIQKAY